MVTDKPGLLPELTCGFLNAVGPRGGRKGLKAVWIEDMTFEVSPTEDREFAKATRQEGFS